MGPVWWVLEPSLYVIVFYLAFAHLRGGGDHVYSLLCGLSGWHWIAGVINQGANSLVRKKGILQSFSIHPIIFPVLTLLLQTFKFSVVLICVITVLWIGGVLKPAGLIDIVLWLATTMFVSFSYAVILSVIIPFAPDIQLIISRAMMLLMFLSGVIFPIGQMSAKAQAYLYWNPFAHLIEFGRKVLLYGESLDPVLISTMLLIHAPILIFGYLILGKLRGEIPKRLI